MIVSISVKIQKMVVLIKWFVKFIRFNLYANRLLAMGFVRILVFNTTNVSQCHCDSIACYLLMCELIYFLPWLLLQKWCYNGFDVVCIITRSLRPLK